MASSISTFFGLETALRGLVASQESLDTTGHNIANASTPGYSRQTANLTTTLPLTVPAQTYGQPIELGSGVTVESVTRSRDAFLDIQWRSQSTQLGYSTAQAQYLETAQTALAEPSDDGLSSQLQTFWNAWAGVSNDPTSTAAKQALLDSAKDVTGAINTLDGRMATVQTQAAAQSTSLLAADGPIKADVDQLTQLNDAIAQATAHGDNPNDLMDTRDQVLDDLSQYAQVSTSNSTIRPGAITVYFGDVSASATPVVDGDVQGPAAEIATWPPSLGSTPPGPGGELGALANLADTVNGPIADLRGQLNGIAAKLATDVNGVYAAGGAGSFFDVTAGSEASTIAVDPAVTVTTVLAGSAGTGTNDIALGMGAVRGAAGGANDLYAAFVSHVGSYVQGADRNESQSQQLANAVDARRQSVSGVSMDEEMTNLITFQRAYQASARVMTTIDSMLDKLINGTGRAGL